MTPYTLYKILISKKMDIDRKFDDKMVTKAGCVASSPEWMGDQLKTFILGLALSIFFAGLPTKVWACGLELCPMELAQDDSQESMPCHQENPASQTVQKSFTATSPFSILASHSACPCPENEIGPIAYLDRITVEKDVKPHWFNNSARSSFDAAQLALFTQIYRPPPSLAPSDLVVLLQKFLI